MGNQTASPREVEAKHRTPVAVSSCGHCWNCLLKELLATVWRFHPNTYSQHKNEYHLKLTNFKATNWLNHTMGKFLLFLTFVETLQPWRFPYCAHTLKVSLKIENVPICFNNQLNLWPFSHWSHFDPLATECCPAPAQLVISLGKLRSLWGLGDEVLNIFQVLWLFFLLLLRHASQPLVGTGLRELIKKKEKIVL